MGVYFLGLLLTDLVYSSGFAMELVPLRSYYTVHSFSCSYQGFAYSFGVRPLSCLLSSTLIRTR